MHESSTSTEGVDVRLANAIDPSNHCMGESLLNYLLPKIHQYIKERDWSQIVVKPTYIRASPAVPAETEKSNKLFNWHRPTATVIDDGTIHINCYPGNDYVQHYAELVATYLSLSGKDSSHVTYILPTADQCMKPFRESNLRDMGEVDVAVVGYVCQLTRFIGPEWHGKSSKDIFAWQKFRTAQGKSVALVGCMPSFWGDISANFVCMLRRLNRVRCVIYIGKAGSLDPRDGPNEVLATGSQSYVSGEKVEWHNVLQPYLPRRPSVAEGVHVNVYSPLVENLQWLKQWRHSCRWVDCEVGHMAKEASKHGVDFGFLHIISDNVTEKYSFDLSNEDLDEVKRLRELLCRDVESILARFFESWASENGTSVDGSSH